MRVEAAGKLHHEFSLIPVFGIRSFQKIFATLLFCKKCMKQAAVLNPKFSIIALFRIIGK